MAHDSSETYDEEMRSFAEELIRFRTVTAREGAERPAQDWLKERLQEFGFATYEWEADPEELARHPSFPDDPDLITTEDRPSVAGVLEFGDPDAGPTLVLNAHMDVVSADEELWTADPFEPRWDGENLVGRGAADLKSALTACVFAARYLAETAEGLNGRLVVESVAGEEDGGIGSAAAALSNPYPFERDAAIVVEPTEHRLVTAMEGTLFLRLEITGRSAHAGTRWKGESVLPHFERIRAAFEDLETERGNRITNPLYEDFEIPWPVNFGIVEAGSWPSSVPSHLTADIRVGVAPRESHGQVEREFQEKLSEVAEADEWLSTHPPTLSRFVANFPSGETSADEAIVRSMQRVMSERGLNTEPKGVPYGADAARYIDMAGIPSVLFGPGSIKQAHNPDETIHWPDVLDAAKIYVDVATEFLG